MERLGITVLIDDESRLKRDVKQICFHMWLPSTAGGCIDPCHSTLSAETVTVVCMESIWWESDSCCGVYRKDLIPFENAKIIFVNEVFAIESPGSQLNVHQLTSDVSDAQQPTLSQ